MASTIPREPYTSADIERIKANYDEEVDTYRLLATIDWMQDELRDRQAEVECKQCGLCGLFTMVKNPHPDAGKPEVALDVGYVWECVPCTRKAAHGWSQRAIQAAAQVEALRTAGDAMAEAVDEQGHYLSAGLYRRCADCDKPSPITTNARDEHYSDCPVLTRRATLEAWRKAAGESA